MFENFRKCSKLFEQIDFENRENHRNFDKFWRKKNPENISHFSTFRDGFLMDRLLVGGVIEARGHERFSLVAQALPEGKEKDFYVAIAKSEEKHKNLFVELAYEYFDKDEVDVRLEELLVAEAEICKNIPFTAALH